MIEDSYADNNDSCENKVFLRLQELFFKRVLFRMGCKVVVTDNDKTYWKDMCLLPFNTFLFELSSIKSSIIVFFDFNSFS